MSENDLKKCPYCAEEIKKEAVFCRFCNHDLTQEKPQPIYTHTQNDPPLPATTPQGPEKNKYRLRNIIFLLILLFIMILCVINLTQGSGGSSGSSNYVYKTDIPTTYPVTYKISGSAEKVAITMQNKSGNTEQFDARLPFTTSFDVTYGDFLYISAQNQGDSGSVTCTISINGKTLETATSSGAYKIASCSGSAK